MATLLTGGCRFVGINAAEDLVARGERVVLADRVRLPSSILASVEAPSDVAIAHCDARAHRPTAQGRRVLGPLRPDQAHRDYTVDRCAQ
jgi:nucleoside-diphosphate-sugar epimerase